MTFIGILLILLGIAGAFMGTLAYGDIAVACFIGAGAALLSGIGLIMVRRKFKRLGL